MQTIVHIGQLKTGTTSIQHYLREKQDALRQRGLYVPDTLGGYDYLSHFLLNVYALDRSRFSPMKERLVAEKGAGYLETLGEAIAADVARHYATATRLGCRTVLWSNEGLYLLNSEEEYRRLRRLFDTYSSEVVCVCCFRERTSFRKSYLAELTKHGTAPSDNPDSYRYIQPDSWLFDYERKETLLQRVFDKVNVFPYDREDMVGAFMRRIGWPLPHRVAIRRNVTEQARPDPASHAKRNTL